VNKDQFEILVVKGLKELEFEDCFLVDIAINNKKVEIFLDSDDQVTFAKCRKLSRFIEEILDEKKWLGESYTLEVSSAGVDRPLKFPRQYVKNIGRKIEVKTKAEETYKGILAEANEKQIKVTWSEKEKQGKKKVTVEKEINLEIEDIDKAKIKVSF
jgi:ribosome maturation factor RimP